MSIGDAELRVHILSVLTENDATMTRHDQVSTWPQDEIEYFRAGDWTDFANRSVRLDEIRREKLADAIVARLRIL